jgi:hypothetical protein
MSTADKCNNFIARIDEISADFDAHMAEEAAKHAAAIAAIATRYELAERPRAEWHAATIERAWINSHNRQAAKRRAGF